jgi:hypothetical protein
MSKYEYLNEFSGGMNNEFEFRDSNKNALDDIKKSDKGYHTWRQRVPGAAKPVKMEVYSSGYTGTPIRDAITGERHKSYLVGSANEDLFFSVRLPGFLGSDGITLFFDSPEDYERHMHTNVTSEMKERWRERKLVAMSNMDTIPRNRTASRYTTVH